MRIAVTYDNGEVFQHFGHTESFKIYEVENNAVTESRVVTPSGGGHGALAGFLLSEGVDTLICGGIGAGAQNALKQAGIALYGGVTGSADDAVQKLISGNLEYSPDIQCGHHGHEGNHSCHGGGHSCGEDKHGCAGN